MAETKWTQKSEQHWRKKLAKYSKDAKAQGYKSVDAWISAHKGDNSTKQGGRAASAQATKDFLKHSIGKRRAKQAKTSTPRTRSSRASKAISRSRTAVSKAKASMGNARKARSR
jgi:hypothetical protein